MTNSKTNMSYTIIVDGNSLLKHVFHGSNKNENKKQFDAAWVFLCVIRKVFKEKVINDGLIFWDGEYSGKLKHDLYSNYKTSRNKIYHYENEEDYKIDEEDEDFRLERKITQDIFFHLHFKQHTSNESEADDCIAKYIIDNPKENIIMITGDSDMFQLLSDKVTIYYLSPKKEKRGFYNPNRFFTEYNYSHLNIPIIKSIIGDTADDIKGIKGWGKKGFFDNFSTMLEKETDIYNISNKAKLINSKLDKPLKKITQLENLQSNKEHKIMFDIINLHKPILDDKDINAVDNLVLDNLDSRNSAELLEIFNRHDYMEKIKDVYHYSDMRTFLSPFFNHIKHQRENTTNINISKPKDSI